MEILEWRIQIAFLNALLIKVETLVEGLVDVAADCVASIRVGHLWIGHQVERVEQHSGPYRQFCAGIGQAGLGGVSFGLNLAQLRLDLGRGERVVGEQVQESVLLGFEFLELAAEGGVKFCDAMLFARQYFFEEPSNVGHKRRWQFQGHIVVGNRLLHPVSGQIRQIANPILAATTQEIPITRTESVLRLGVNQA